MKPLVWTLVLAVVALTGCATQKEWFATGGSRADGTVKLSYEYGAFERPQLSETKGTALAKSRCAVWGYTGAEPFGGQTQACNEYFGRGCNRWLVTREYQCTGTGNTETSAAPSPQSTPSSLSTAPERTPRVPEKRTPAHGNDSSDLAERARKAVGASGCNFTPIIQSSQYTDDGSVRYSLRCGGAPYFALCTDGVCRAE